jgi:hypothetical protein
VAVWRAVFSKDGEFTEFTSILPNQPTDQPTHVSGFLIPNVPCHTELYLSGRIHPTASCVKQNYRKFVTLFDAKIYSRGSKK